MTAVAALIPCIACAEYSIQNSEITPDRKGFTISLSTPPDPQLGTLTATVFITKDGSIVTIATGAGSRFMFDAANTDQMTQLRNVLETMEQWLQPFQENPSAFYRADKPSATFHGPIGDYKLAFNAERRGSEFRGSFDVTGPELPTAIPLDAQALAYTFRHTEDFHKLYASALERTEKGAVVQKQQQERAADERIAAEKQASEQRLKEYRAQKEAEFGKAAADREVQQIKAKEKQQQAQMDVEFKQKQLNKIAMFKASRDGAKLWGNVEQLVNTVQSKEAQEMAYLKRIEKDITTATIASDPRKKQLISQLAEAMATHHDSPELTKNKEELKDALAKLKESLGISYQDAVEAQQAAINQVQGTIDNNTSKAAPTP